VVVFSINFDPDQQKKEFHKMIKKSERENRRECVESVIQTFLCFFPLP
jgi:metal-responsive CopG/Arc/MetJ family transcriptional regulator